MPQVSPLSRARMCGRPACVDQALSQKAGWIRIPERPEMTATPKKHPGQPGTPALPEGPKANRSQKAPCAPPRVTPAQASDSLPVKARARQTIAVTAPQLKKNDHLMQFARRAGKLISGYDACLRAMHHTKLYLVLLAEDTARGLCRGIDHPLMKTRSPSRSCGPAIKPISARLWLTQKAAFSGLGINNSRKPSRPVPGWNRDGRNLANKST